MGRRNPPPSPTSPAHLAGCEAQHVVARRVAHEQRLLRSLRADRARPPRVPQLSVLLRCQGQGRAAGVAGVQAHQPVPRHLGHLLKFVNPWCSSGGVGWDAQLGIGRPARGRTDDAQPQAGLPTLQPARIGGGRAGSMSNSVSHGLSHLHCLLNCCCHIRSPAAA